MVKENVVEFTTSHVQTLVKIFEMSEGVASEEVNIILKKDRTKEKKVQNNNSDSDSSDSEQSSDSDSESNNDSNSDVKVKNKKLKKADKKKEKDKDKDKDKKKKKEAEDKKKKKGGLLIKTMNNHQTTISLVKLNVDMFDYFYIKDEEFSFWIDVKELNKFLKCVECENHKLTMYVEDGDKAIKLKINHNEKENKFKSYEQSFIESEINMDVIPKPEFDYVISINSQLFKKVCNDMRKFSDYMEIKCNGEKLLFQCLTKYNRLNIDSYENNDGDIKIQKLNNNNKEIKSSYYLDYLLKLKYSSSICDDIMIHLKHKSPLFINSDLLSGDFVCGKMLVYFAPHDEEIADNDYHNKTKDLYEEKKTVIKS